MMSLQIPGMSAALSDTAHTANSVREEVSMLKSLPADELVQKLASSVVSFAINLAVAVVVFYLGRLIINKLYRVISNICLKRDLDRSLVTFVLSFTRIVLYFILIVAVIGILGIETSSFIALFASAGVAIGMALSGTLQNFAGGVLILFLKPYKIGDYIEAQGYAGTVREIQIFHTIMTTADNKSIIIPNGGLSTGSINNWSREDYRRIDWLVGISYGDDVDRARTKILEMLAEDPRITDEYIPSSADLINKPEDRSAKVVVAELADSSVQLKITAWAKTSDYWNVFYAINERIYKELPASAGVNFPFPQLQIHQNS